MFCYQCQETAKCTGCTITGVCGKNPQVAAAQELLVYVTKGYCEVTTRLRKEGTNISDAENRMVVMNLFMTITNANFDKEAIENRIHDTLHVKKVRCHRAFSLPFLSDKLFGEYLLMN